MAVVTVSNATYHINNGLIAKWDKIKDGKLKKQDNDKVYIVDGRERTGKSTFAIQQACYIDPTLIDDVSRICFTADEFLDAIRKTDSDEKVTKCIIFDEAFRGLSSRGAMSKINKKIIQALMEVGQKNLVIFIVLPSFFMLDIYPAMLRSNALFHIAMDNRSKKRVFYIYPHKKKGMLYQSGIRKGWSYEIRTRNKGNFYDNFPKQSQDEKVKAFYKKYLEKKRNSLVEDEIETVEFQEEGKYKQMLKVRCYKLVKTNGLSLRETSKQLKEEGYDISHVQVAKFVDEIDKMIMFRAKKEQYFKENSEKLVNC